MYRPEPSHRIPVVALTFLFFAATASATSNGNPPNGVPTEDGHPNWSERILVAASNWCRTQPRAFQQEFLPANPSILSAAVYPPVNPLHWSPSLNHCSRGHATDMAVNHCFQHESCNGTTPGARLASCYDDMPTSWGENIAANQVNAFEAVKALILDNNAPDNNMDGGGPDGHRENIMKPSFTELGAGYATGTPPPWSRYYVQDFGGGLRDFESPILTATHMFYYQNGSGQLLTTFWMTYWSPAGVPATEVTLLYETAAAQMAEVTADPDVVINGGGTTVRGTFRLELLKANACRRYAFRVRDNNGATYYYPEQGSLVTTGEGGCTQEYSPLSFVSVEPSPAAAVSFAIAPNPVVDGSTISFTLPEAGVASVRIVDLAGRLVRRLRDGWALAGPQQLRWDGRDRNGALVESGIYFVALDGAGVKARGKLAVLDAR